MMNPKYVNKLTWEGLRKYTDDFSEENFIGNFQFGKVYHGKIVRITTGPQYMTVKIWEVPKMYKNHPVDSEIRLMDEVLLLRHEKFFTHPGMVKMYGYCYEDEHVGVVYQFDPMDTVHNILPNDDFGWLQRIKVALGLARLLKFLHARNPVFEPFLIRNLDASHVLVDKDYNPKLFDFGMISGGIFPDRTSYQIQDIYDSYGFIDPCCQTIGGWTVKSDVFAFGVLLLGLITKRVFTVEDWNSFAPEVFDWAQEYESDKSDTGISQSKHSRVHESLMAEPYFCTTDGLEITRLAIRCVEQFPGNRPTMKQVVKGLLNLQIVHCHADLL